MEQSFPCTSSESWVNFNLRCCDISLLWDQREILLPWLYSWGFINLLCWWEIGNSGSFLYCLGGQKFWILSCVVWGLRNSESSPGLFEGSEILNPSFIVWGVRNSQSFLYCFGGSEFWLLSCVVWGIRNSESSPVWFGGSEILNPSFIVWGVRNSDSSPLLFGGSEILNPLLCCLVDQKFWILHLLFGGSEILTPLHCCLGGQIFWLLSIVVWGGQKFWLLSCVVWGVRNSESSSVFFGGSEILNPLLCCLQDQKFWLLYFFVWGIRNSESSPVFFEEPNKVEIKNRKLLGRILRFLANRETFPVSFNTKLRLRGNCKNRLWN